jgi:hypothetical protein
MKARAGRSERVFKTAWFSKAALKARIPDAELCTAIRQVMLGQADDLGGSVFKKRLGRNLYRSMWLPRAETIGFTSISSRRMIGPILKTMN